jgi:hypothetical protein
MENSKWLHIICIAILTFCWVGCEHEEINHSKMVVEGWIDAGKHPIVILHSSYSLTDTVPDSTSLLDVLAEHLIPFGRVVLFDGEDSVVLTGRLDTNYMPPCIYTTTKIRGEVGKTYTLRATYKDFIAKSQTYIPEIARFDSIRVIQINQKMNVIGYANHLEIGKPYIVMARKDGQKQYKVCPIGTFRANATQMAITINNPINFSGEGMMLQTLFPQSDDLAIDIKFAQVDEAEYEFWDSFVAQQFTQGIFFMETHSNIMSNIQGGNGYWCGMGASEYRVKLSKDSTYVF